MMDTHEVRGQVCVVMTLTQGGMVGPGGRWPCRFTKLLLLCITDERLGHWCLKKHCVSTLTPSDGSPRKVGS